MRTILYFFLLLSFSANGQSLYFPPTNSDEWQSVSTEELNWCEEHVAILLSFLEEKQTKGFILLKDGKIVIEEYFDGHTQDSVWYWASAGKSLNAFEIGMLQEQGLLNINDASTDYLGAGWTSCLTSEEEQITLKNQLTMTTGFDFSGGMNLDCTDPECLECANAPGEEWFYHNAPYTLLSDVIENVTNRTHTLHTFLTLGNSVGVVGAWIPLGYNKVFFSTTRAMARFGLLMNARGEWDGQTILGDEEYFDQMITPSQDINESYGYLWWLNTGPTFRLPSSTFTFQGKMIPDAPDYVYMAIGKNSQLIIVDPVENIIIIRMGDDPDESLVPTTFINDLWTNVSAVTCLSTSTDESHFSNTKIHPNPVSDYLKIKTEDSIKEVHVYDLSGNLEYSDYNQDGVDIRFLPSGMHVLHIQTEKEYVVKRFVKY